MSARKITTWHKAGLIDAGARDRLLAHEATHARPLALRAVFGIGALAIGLVSVVAANWEDIPAQVRLGIHLALIAVALAALFWGDAPPAALCLQGKAPVVTRAIAITAMAACANPLRADTANVYGGDALARGRLYVGQGRALALEQSLAQRDQRGIVQVRQRKDGSFTPISIRFRPLTPAEIAERDAQDTAPVMPPAIMLPETGASHRP